MTSNDTANANNRRIPKWMIVTIVALLLALAVFAYYQFVAVEGPVPEDAGEAYIALEQGYTAQGFPRLGDANAPVLVEEFSSYACPHCLDFHEERFPDLLDEIAAGQVQYVVIPMPNIGPGAKDAATALLCAGEQDRLWTMHDVLFHWQAQFLTRTFAKKRVLDGALKMGLDVDAFEACIDSSQTDRVLDAARTEFRVRGLTGTPSFFINGEKVQNFREFEDLGTLAESLRAGS